MKKYLRTAASALLATALLAACASPGGGTTTATPSPPPPGGTTNQATTDPTPPPDGGFDPASFPPAPADYTINILTVSHTGDIIPGNHPAILQLQEHTGYNINLEFVLNANYEEMMNTRFAAGNLPGIVVITGNTLPIVTAAQSGAFWDITDKFPLYSNLAGANPAIMNNISIDGRNFGIYRQRIVGRGGMVYRSDWLEYLGLEEPQTIDDLYNVLQAFTTQNPQPNGGTTFGMNWSVFMGPFHNLAVMHGAPNRWEVVNGEFIPWFEHEGFYEAMQFSRRLFESNVINQDFAALPTGEWALPFGTGRAGWHIDVADEANRSANRLRDNGFMSQEEVDAGDKVWVMGPVANRHGERRAMATPGHAGYVAISTTGARTLQDLHYHLDFLNMLNDPIGQNIVSWGAEDINWEMRGDNVFVFPAGDIADGWHVIEGLNQFMMRQNYVTPVARNPRQDRQEAVFLENLAIAIHDPTLPFRSETWTARSASLNEIIDDAVSNYIMGNIDRAGFDSEVSRWYNEGGSAAIAEFNAAWAAVQ